MTRKIILVEIGSGLTLTGALPSVALHGSYGARLTARGGMPPYTYTIVSGMLPGGMFLDAGTGLIAAGEVTEAGSFPITVRATDLSGTFVDRKFTITVIAEPLMLSGTAPDGTVGTAYSYTYTTGGGDPPYSYAIASGALPAGLSLNASTGQISGMPTSGGSYAWTVRVTDSASVTFDLPDSINVSYASLALTGDFPDATVGTAYDEYITISGGDGSYTLTGGTGVSSGSLPAGLSLSIASSTHLRLHGTPTTAATFTFTASVDSGDWQTATSAQSMTVSSTTYAKWNSADKGAHIVLSLSDLAATSDLPTTSTTWNMVRGTIAKSSGKCYAEIHQTVSGAYGYGAGIGLATSSESLTAELGSGSFGWGLYARRAITGIPILEHAGAITNYPSMTNQGTNERAMIAVDFGAGKGWIGSNNVWAGGGNPATGTTPTFTFTPGTALFIACAAINNAQSTQIYTSGSFSFAPPAGFTGRWAT